MIRYFCHTDPSGPRGDFCARYAEAFVAMAFKLRVIPVEVPRMALSDEYQPAVLPAPAKPTTHRWLRLQSYLRTPINEPYVNVVCADPFWWGRLYTVGVKNVLITQASPEQVAAARDKIPDAAQLASQPRREVINGQVVEFQTFEVPRDAPDPRDAAIRYDTIVVPTDELAAAWRALIDEQATVDDEIGPRGVCQVVVIGLDLPDRLQSLRAVFASG